MSGGRPVGKPFFGIPCSLPHANLARGSGDLGYFGRAMSFGFNDPFSAAPPAVQIRRVGAWKAFAGAVVAAAALGFAGFMYVGPYQKLTKIVRDRTSELNQQQGSTDQLTEERDKLKAALATRVGSEQEKAAVASKQTDALQSLAADLKGALASAKANTTASDGRVRVSFPAESLFEQPTSTGISPAGDAALKALVASLKQTGMRARVRAKLIPAAPPRELAQFKNIGEFEILRAARVMLALANGGVAADHLAVAGEVGPGGARKGKAALPERLDVEIEPE
jgi:hypothetical protein